MADEAEIRADGVGVALGLFPPANFLKQPRQHPEEGDADGRADGHGLGRRGVGAGVAGAVGELVAPFGGGEGVRPAQRHIGLPGPGEPGQDEGELGLPVGGDFQGGGIAAVFHLEVHKPGELVALAGGEVRLIFHNFDSFMDVFLRCLFRWLIPGEPFAGKAWNCAFDKVAKGRRLGLPLPAQTGRGLG